MSAPQINQTKTKMDPYEGNGASTSFPIDFLFIDESDIKCRKVAGDGTVHDLTYSTDYTVEKGELGGSLKFPATESAHSVLAEGETLYIYRKTEFTQKVTFSNDGVWDMEVVGWAVNKITMLCQELSELTGRSITFDINSTASGVSVPEPESGRALTWDLSAEALENGPTANEIASAQGYAESAASSSASAEAAREAAEAAAASVPEYPPDANVVEYDNTTSEMDATNVQDALDALDAEKQDNLPLSARGDILTRDENGDLVRVAAGSEGQAVLYNSDGDPTPTTLPPGVPVGTVLFTADNAVPVGFLYCNGAAISRTTYADLFAQVGTLYGVGDGSTTFNIPDLRDEFIRGAGSTGEVGDTQADATAVNGLSVEIYTGSGNLVDGIGHSYPVDDETWNTSRSRITSTDTETRPQNMQLLPVIKY